MNKHIGVRFVYEEDKPPSIGKRLSTVDNTLTPESLAALPTELLAMLTQGAEEADIELLSSIIERLRECDAVLAETLRRMVEGFEYDKILALIQGAE